MKEIEEINKEISELEEQITEQRKKISELEEQITERRKEIIKAKLRGILTNIQIGEEQSPTHSLQSPPHSLYQDNEIYVLSDMLEENGLERDTDFICESQLDSNGIISHLFINIGDKVLHFDGGRSITDILDMKDIRELAQEAPESDEGRLLKLSLESDEGRLLKLKPIDFQILGIETTIRSTIASDGNEFSGRILRYATERCEVRNESDKAKQLYEDYEKQLPKSLDDNN